MADYITIIEQPAIIRTVLASPAPIRTAIAAATVVATVLATPAPIITTIEAPIIRTVLLTGQGPAGVAGSDGQTPFHIPPDETFSVQANRHAPLVMNLRNDGLLITDGFMIEVR